MLLEHGADPFLKASNGQTVFYICLTLKKLDLLRNFMHCVSLNKDPTLFFAFAPNILNGEYQKILFELFEQEKPGKEALAELDEFGYTPFLAFVNEFVKQMSSTLSTIQGFVRKKFLIKGTNSRKGANNPYQLTNEMLFDGHTT